MLKHGRSTVNGWSFGTRNLPLSYPRGSNDCFLYGWTVLERVCDKRPCKRSSLLTRACSKRLCHSLSLARSLVRHTRNTIIFFLKRCSLTRLYLNTESRFRVEQRGSVLEQIIGATQRNNSVSRRLEKFWKRFEGIGRIVKSWSREVDRICQRIILFVIKK